MTTISTSRQQFDPQRAEAFSDELMRHFSSSFVTYMVDVGHRTGLFDAMAQGPVGSDELAARAGLQERYVREWLGAVVSAGVADFEPTTGEYSLPPEHAAALCGDTAQNIAPLSLLSGLLAQHIQPVARSFREGGGVHYGDYRPDFTDVMDGLGRGVFDALLIDEIVPLAAGLPQRLLEGCTVADIGCGTGHSTNLLARAFPRSRFLGYDIDAGAVDRARSEAADYGLDNVRFEVQDVSRLSAPEPFGAVFAFDAIHDQADPAGVLARVHAALEPGGIFAMFDIRASSHLDKNLDNPFAPMLYGISTLHCLTISLAEGGAGLGTVWGEELALAMLADAGFVDATVHEVPGDPLDSLYVAHKSRR